ncbi:hypothetical protein [Aeromicrobium sp.]|uniref:hypothetical protein n=1 Tax=Aeromicrobium sp. TaxID=1871063 RepID=UPI0019C39F1C|nr:hypothetical protein [Aeromicrobium sp.]MBC7632804.1 hypothetical protein [Aeromicrobium sp.]
MSFRPAIRPGAPLLRRDITHLQVGTSPGIVVSDQPGLLPLLRLADGARDVARLAAMARESIPELTVDVALLMNELRSVGAVFDASRWSAPGRRGVEPEARHTDVGGNDPALLLPRATFRVAIHHDAASRPIVEAAQSILTMAGVVDLDSTDPQLLVIASCGEPARTVFERPILHGVDHLPLVIDEDRVRLGPFVRPGRTPCITCHDLHRTDWDRAWPAILSQLARHTLTMTPPAISATTAHAAALELAVEVLAHVDGLAPRTLGRCLAVGPGPDDRASWPIAFHHRCTCDLLNAA